MVSGRTTLGLTPQHVESKTSRGLRPSECTTLSFPTAMCFHLDLASSKPPGSSWTQPWATSALMSSHVSCGSTSAPDQLVKQLCKSSVGTSEFGFLGHMWEAGIGVSTPVGTPCWRWWCNSTSASCNHWDHVWRSWRRNCWPGAIVQSKFSPCSWDQWWAICFKGLSSVSVSGGSDRCSWRCWATRSRRLFWSPYSNSRFRRSAKRSCQWGRVQSAELGIPPPSLRDLRGEGSGGCRRGWSQSTTCPLEVHLLEMIWAIAMANGYSAVSELRKDPSSFLTPAKDGCRVGQVHQPAKDEIVASFEHRSQDLESCMPHWHAATWAQVAFQSLNISVLSLSNNVIAVGGVSHPTRAPLQCAAWSRTRPRRCTSSSSCSLCCWSADKSSLPSGCSGVLNATGPLGLSFSLEYSRHGGAPKLLPQIHSRLCEEHVQSWNRQGCSSWARYLKG